MNREYENPDASPPILPVMELKALRQAPPQQQRQYQQGDSLQRLRKQQAQAQEKQMD